MSTTPATIPRSASATAARPPAPAGGTPHGAAFAAFLVVNAFLFLRPSDIYAPLYGVEIYQYVIGLCMLLAVPALIELFSGGRLGSMPAAACVLGLLPVVFASSLVNVGPEEALGHVVAFAKIIAYFLLLLALVTTPRRLKVFVGFLVFFAAVMAILSVLDFYKVIELIRPKEINGHKITLERDRMYGPGLFGDPNDLCTILVTMLLLAAGLLTDSRSGAARVLWLIPCGLLAFGFVLTQSRGGLIAMLAGAGLYIRLRYGWGRAVALGALGVPVLLLFAVAGRQGGLSTKAETATQRIQLWSDALVMFKGQPVLGGGYDQFAKGGRLLAHNSYMQFFAELGFVGGTLFVSAAALSVAGLYRLTLPRRPRGVRVPVTPVVTDPTLRHYHPFLAGAVTAYCTGMFSLSLNYLVSTYTIFGLAATFLSMAETAPPRAAVRFGLELLFRLAIFAVAVVVMMFVFVRLNF
jgi:putative inorganic carbon (HCO3(-)) transporter